MLTQYFDLLTAYIGNHPTAAIAIVFLISMGEALFVVGLFIPSTVVLVGAGTLVGLGKLSFLPILVSASLGATAGDAVSYWFGHVYKDRVRRMWPFSRYALLLDRGEQFFDVHGGKSVFIGRFIPGVKAVVPGIAGIAGMNPVRFAVINVVSAVAWSASHLLPGMGIGRAASVAGAGNPRLLELILLLSVLLVVAWYATKFTMLWMLPHLDRLRQSIDRGLASSRFPGVRHVRRLLLNEDDILVAFLLAGLAVGGLVTFGIIVIQLLFDPAFVRADQAISNYIQTLRTPSFDRAMITITMLGDSVVLTPIAVAAIVTIFWQGYRRLAAAVAAAFIAATVFVPLLKSIVQRARPLELYQGAESFSFPSGHATLSVTIIGILLLLCAHGLTLRNRLAVYLAGAMLIAAIGFSRLYLLAHWPSDVAAGMVFGASLVFVMAWLIHKRPRERLSPNLAIVVALSASLAYPLHYWNDFSRASVAYAHVPQVIRVSQTDWLADPVQFGPTRRLLLDGEFGEPMLLRTDIALPRITESLVKAGWALSPPGQLYSLIGAILPSRAAASDLSPLPLTNKGKPPLAVLTRPRPGGGVLVLRLWTTGIAIEHQGVSRPLLVASVLSQMADNLLLGFNLPEPAEITPAAQHQHISEVARLIADGAGGDLHSANGLVVVAAHP